MDIIDIVEEYLCNDVMPSSNGLFHGKAGLAVYFAIMSQFDDKYKCIYRKVINDVVETSSSIKDMSLGSGLLGIGVSMLFISSYIEKKESEYLLNELDECLIKKMNSIQKLSNSSEELNYHYFEILFYMTLRIKYSIKSHNKRMYLEQLIKKSIETLYPVAMQVQHVEILPFNIINSFSLFMHSLINLYSLGIYKNRIKHLFVEIAYSLRIPTLHINRLSVLYIIVRALRTIEELPYEWTDYKTILKQHTSIDVIIRDEMSNNQLDFIHGVSGAFLLAKLINEEEGNLLFDVNKQKYNRIVQNASLVKNKNKSFIMQHCCLNGFCGMRILYDKL